MSQDPVLSKQLEEQLENSSIELGHLPYSLACFASITLRPAKKEDARFLLKAEC